MLSKSWSVLADVFNHNLETVPSRYLRFVLALLFHSIRLLQRVKELDPTISPNPVSWSVLARAE